MIRNEVRRNDYNRYLSALFAPKPARSHLFALYAFHHEVAKTAETVHDPQAGLIRLQWWREAVDEIYADRPPRHRAALGLAEIVRAHDLPRALLAELIDAREHDLEPEPFANLAELENYADKTSSNIMRLAARILGAERGADAYAREAGIAYAMTGLLRALPFNAARRHLVLPRDMLAESNLSAEDIFAGRNSAALKSIIGKIGDAVRAHLARLRALPKPGAVLPALLPASLCPLYLRVICAPQFDPFHDSADIAPLPRQWAMLRASVRGCV